MHQHGMAMDSLLASSKAVGTRAYVVDPLNSVRAVIDGVGTTVNSYDYFAYGDARTTLESEESRFRFSGRDFESQSGLLFARNRFYKPSIGRWVKGDPIGFRGGFNLYRYVRNNPAKYTDPRGLTDIQTGSKECQTAMVAFEDAEAALADALRTGNPGAMAEALAAAAAAASAVFAACDADLLDDGAIDNDEFEPIPPVLPLPDPNPDPDPPLLPDFRFDHLWDFDPRPLLPILLLPPVCGGSGGAPDFRLPDPAQ